MLPNITFVIHDCVGGIAYMNHQIIEHGKISEHFNVRIILIKNKEDSTIRFTDKFKAQEVEFFNYSAYDNYLKVLKKLSKVLNKSTGIIVTNDGMELKTIELFGTKSAVYSIVHDFYNFKLAILNYHLTNVFLCHTLTYTNTLKSAGTIKPRIDFLPHGVAVNKLTQPILSENKPLKVITIGRLVKTKGVLLLYEIENLLVTKGIKVEWVIIGSGVLENELKEQWKDKTNIIFQTPLRNEDVMNIAKECDVFVSASEFEGYGIALLEAMACGLVPIVYELPVGISTLLPAEVGFKVNIPDIKVFAEKIELLHQDRILLNSMKNNAYAFCNSNYNIIDTSKQYLFSFLNCSIPLARVKQIKSFGLLDKWYIPNNFSRKLKKLRVK